MGFPLRVNNMAIFSVPWASQAVNSIKLFRNLSQRGYGRLLELLAMQLWGDSCVTLAERSIEQSFWCVNGTATQKESGESDARASEGVLWTVWRFLDAWPGTGGTPLHFGPPDRRRIYNLQMAWKVGRAGAGAKPYFAGIWLKSGVRDLSTTLIERKSRMPQMQDVKGEAVVCYREPLTTQQMGYHRLSRRVNKIEK
jgi:hypothetical protein